jgi:pyruvate/2-oxoglutarate dehydrogenase complex dihydrolipoamide dehydrogenase (E3) component
MEQIAYQPDWHKLMVAKHGIAVRLGQAVTAEQLKFEKPDLVVVATGARPALPRIEGLEAAMRCGFAFTIDDVLAKGKRPLTGQLVVIYGSGEGIELSLDLVRSGYQVR